MHNEYIPPNYHVQEEVARVLDEYMTTRPLKPFPIDIEQYLEKEYDITIVPTSTLEIRHATDSVLATDFKTIYLDMDQYMDPSGRYDARIRFSLAHELGHIRLHKRFFEQSVKIIDCESVKTFHFDSIDEERYKKIEFQANAFAGNFLVPSDLLIKSASAMLLDKLDQIYENGVCVGRLLSILSPKLSKQFGVSDRVIEKRIDSIGLANVLKLDIEAALNEQVKKNDICAILKSKIQEQVSF